MLVANICGFVGPPAVVLAVGLSKLDDAFMIREELMGTIIIGYVIQGMDNGWDYLLPYSCRWLRKASQCLHWFWPQYAAAASIPFRCT